MTQSHPTIVASIWHGHFHATIVASIWHDHFHATIVVLIWHRQFHPIAAAIRHAGERYGIQPIAW